MTEWLTTNSGSYLRTPGPPTVTSKVSARVTGMVARVKPKIAAKVDLEEKNMEK